MPAGVVVEAAEGVCVRDAGIGADVAIPSTCGGVGSCGLCKVIIAEGAENLNPLTPPELDKLGNVFFITKERLACQCVPSGDVSCNVPDDAAERTRRIEKSRALSRQRHEQRQAASGSRGRPPPGRR